ncbi:hypothetical protein [Clostridium minihomine]|uniref:hypothetical protein n=1 Tax=Clostridium minihomine TaxID=2045012 RepID=UPI000C780D05|nr:hypothetical protein [Clostridium minihomine]
MKVSRFFSLLLFGLVLAFLWIGFSRVAETNQQENRTLLLQNIDRAVLNCYAIEGMYPPTFQYLQQNYGVQVDSEKYYVDYQIFASNIKPVIQILERGNATEEVQP